jgi:glycosidase
MSYHGYAITDFYKIDPRYGTLQDYLDLCREAHSAGIKIVMDMIMNHCGLEHWWMKDLPDDEWINLANQPYTETNHLKTAPSDPYAARSDLEAMTRGWFVPTMPDLNVTHPLLAEYLITNTIWWIETARLNGIRMDTYPYPDKDFMREWARRVAEEYPGFLTVGEVWHYEPSIIAYWQDREDNPDGYRSYLPSVFDFSLQGAVHTAFQEPEGWERGLYKLYEAVSLDFVYPDPHKLVTFVDNHDMSRVLTSLDGDISKTKNALAFILTFRGIPAIFYGTEILMTHPGTDAHGAIRADFPGGWAGDEQDGFTSKGLDTQASEMQKWLRGLLKFRSTSKALVNGKLTHFSPQSGVYVMFRYNDKEKVMIIIRKGSTEAHLDLGRFATLLEGHQQGRDVLTGRTYGLDKPIPFSGPDPLILHIE